MSKQFETTTTAAHFNSLAAEALQVITDRVALMLAQDAETYAHLERAEHFHDAGDMERTTEAMAEAYGTTVAVEATLMSLERIVREFLADRRMDSRRLASHLDRMVNLFDLNYDDLHSELVD